MLRLGCSADVSQRGGNLSQPEANVTRLSDGMLRLGCSADVSQRGGKGMPRLLGRRLPLGGKPKASRRTTLRRRLPLGGKPKATHVMFHMFCDFCKVTRPLCFICFVTFPKSHARYISYVV